MSLPKRILITGVYGQIGRALAIDLIGKGCEVTGIERFEANVFAELHAAGKLAHQPRVFIGEMAEKNSVLSILKQVQPEYIVHLAACVHVGESFIEPVGVLRNNIFSTLAVLDAAKELSPSVGLFNAATPEIFGDQSPPQTEATSFAPQSPYAVSKAAAVYLTRLYRSRGMRFSNGYIYNTESIDRSPRYVLRKMTQAAPRIRLGLQPHLSLGSLDTRRSWMAREDTVAAIEAIMALPEGDDFIIAPPASHCRSVRELAELVFQQENMPITWHTQTLGSPSGVRPAKPAEVGVTTGNRIVIMTDDALLRPLDAPNLQGDASKLTSRTGWRPQICLEALIKTILASDACAAEAEARQRGLLF
ncbi:MAG TPA: GDP-mannose 4,6-dehydratase [Candidatus Acidoferrum sp.]|nr:GDP-mannose 4,6-dehydratase [Candidatus Acidoferrum sp.]